LLPDICHFPKASLPGILWHHKNAIENTVMTASRDSFHSRLGFVLAAAGSAIGLGNIWGFPTQVANNGGGAFLLVYLMVTLLLALPALYAEMYLGNQMQKNPVGALAEACQDVSPGLGRFAGLFGLSGAILMTSFYTIVAGWMLAHALAPMATGLELADAAHWLSNSSVSRSVVFAPVFVILGAGVIHKGVHEGIEKWSTRLMPMLLVMLVGLIIYILGQEGADEGVALYLIPDFSRLSDPRLIISAMGQAFFSLSIGVGGMMVYGSYLKKDQNIGKLVVSITVLDTLIAFLAGLLIIPALFVAQHAGQAVFTDGKLIGEGQLIFHILPALFDSMGQSGLIVAASLFTLLSLAALTSIIPSLEVPVSYLVEDKKISRDKAIGGVAITVLCFSMTIIAFFELLFGLIVAWVSTIQLPIMGLFYFIVVGWLYKRGNRLTDKAALAQSRKLWLWGNYLRFVCPVLISLVFINLMFSSH
jgi:NSS family neurotransmitter:Na+ symporter